MCNTCLNFDECETCETHFKVQLLSLFFSFNFVHAPSFSFFSSIEASSLSFLFKALSWWWSSSFHGLFPSGWRLLSPLLLIGCTTYSDTSKYSLHDKLMHSFHNRQACSLEGFIVFAHRWSCPVRCPLPRPAPCCWNPGPHVLKTPPSPHRLSDLQDKLDKRMHFLPQLSDFVPLKNGFYSFRAQADLTSPCWPW